MHSTILTRHRPCVCLLRPNSPWCQNTPSAVLEHYGWSGLALRLFPTTDTDIAPKDSMQKHLCLHPEGPPQMVKPKSLSNKTTPRLAIYTSQTPLPSRISICENNCPAQEPDIHQEWQPGNYHPSISW